MKYSKESVDTLAVLYDTGFADALVLREGRIVAVSTDGGYVKFRHSRFFRTIERWYPADKIAQIDSRLAEQIATGDQIRLAFSVVMLLVLILMAAVVVFGVNWEHFSNGVAP